MSEGSLFTVQIGAFVEKAKGNVDLVFRKATLDIFTRVVMKSPVLTGRFRGSWQCTIGSIPAGQVNHLDPAGGETIARIAAKTQPAKAGDVIFLTNNLPYAQKIEFGHSKQAPSGVVRLTILEWNTAVAKAVQSVQK